MNFLSKKVWLLFYSEEGCAVDADFSESEEF